nr:hypothetical protein [Tanacetum cinerariifolium]
MDAYGSGGFLHERDRKRVIPPFDEIITIVDYTIVDELKDTAIDTRKSEVRGMDAYGSGGFLHERDRKRVIPPFDEIITIVDYTIVDELKDTAIDTRKSELHLTAASRLLS